MKAILNTFLMLTLAVFLTNCGGSNPMGSKVKEPFQGSKYESSNRWFRAVGKGTSKDDNIAKSKADLQAKKELAQQVETNIKAVSEQFLFDIEVNEANEINDKFQEIARQVTNTTIVDLRKMDEEKFYNGEQYTVFIAYEIKKAAMFRFMKKQARADNKISKLNLKKIEDLLDSEIERAEAGQ